jgi:hypothetical protein
MPLLLSSNNFQVLSASVASAVVIAIPVTTTSGNVLANSVIGALNFL